MGNWKTQQVFPKLPEPCQGSEVLGKPQSGLTGFASQPVSSDIAGKSAGLIVAAKPCSFPGCQRPRDSRGLCTSHRWQRAHGATLRPIRTDTPIPARFWAQVDTSAGPGACWPWRGKVNESGYGVFLHAPASRYACALAHGVPMDSESLVAMHRCDNPPCVNPNHLKWGSRADNNRDMREKGRISRGAARWNAHLTPALVVEARFRVSAGESRASVARSFGICASAIDDAVAGKTWSHVVGLS